MTITDPLSDNLVAALRTAPELYSSPGLATSAAQSDDPTTSAEITAHASNQYAGEQAYDAAVQHHGQDTVHKALGWLGGAVGRVANTVGNDVLRPVGKLVSPGLQSMGAPLRVVQRDYRYLHDVEARHGPLAALLEGLGIGAGAVAGGYFGGQEGALLGGEAAATALGKLVYSDSWDRVNSGAQYQGTYNRQTGQYSGAAGDVSVGRDVANVAGLRHVPGLTGAIDGLMDLTLDPLVIGGKLVGAARSAEGASGALEALAPGRRFVLGSDVQNAYDAYPSVRRAFEYIAGLSEGEVTTAYPKLTQIADHLGNASTADEVKSVFQDAAIASTITNTDVLPSRLLASIPLQVAKEGIQNYEGPGVAAIRQLSTLLPAGKEVDLSGQDWRTPVYRVLRFGQSRRVAEMAIDELGSKVLEDGAPDLAARREVFKTAVQSALVKMGIPADSDALQSVAAHMDGAIGGGPDAMYGTDVAGRDLSKTLFADGAERTSAISLNQKGLTAVPDFSAAQREIRSLKSYSSLYGKLDDWAWTHFTQGIFKPMALLSLGFAQRIAAAEAIPAGLREGFGNLLGSSIAATKAKLGYDIETGEAGHVAAAVYRVLDGVPAALLDPSKVDLATKMVIANRGHILDPLLDTSHGGSSAWGGATEVTNDLFRGLQRVPEAVRGSDDFEAVSKGSKRMADAWFADLREQSNDPIHQAAASAYLDGMRSGKSQEEATATAVQAAKRVIDEPPAGVNISDYDRHYNPASGHAGMDPHESWARVVTDRVVGATHYLDPAGTAVPHVDILGHLAEGKDADLSAMKTAVDAVPAEQQPQMMKWRVPAPPVHGSLIQRIADQGFNKVLNPMVNFLSREPLYMTELTKQYEALAPLADADFFADDAERLATAQGRAVNKVLPFIHNVNERSQFASTARNYMPFYFAQTQSFRRLGRLLEEDPGAFRQFQLLSTSLHNTASQQQGSGGPAFVYPGSGFIGKAVPSILNSLGIPMTTAVPVTFSGDIRSLNTVMPFAEGAQGLRPKFGPLVSIAGHLVSDFMPEANPAVSKVIGDQAASGGIWDQLVPNSFLRNTVKAFGNEHKAAFASAMMNTIQAMEYQDSRNPAVKEWYDKQAAGEDPGAFPGVAPPSSASTLERQQFVDRVKNQTRVNFLLRAVASSVSPASPQFQIGDVQLRSEVRDLIAANGVAKGIDLFLQAHPDATPYTVFQSDNPTKGSFGATADAEQFINDHMDTMTKYPFAGAWLIPQTAGKFDQAVYNEQLAQHLRDRKAPEQFLNDLYIAAGNAKFYGDTGDKAAYDKAITAAGDDPTAKAAVRKAFNDYLSKQAGPQNPVWYSDFTSPDRQHDRQFAIQQFVQMDKAGDLVGPQADGIRMLLADYERYKQSTSPGSDSRAMATTAELKDAWQAYMDRIAVQQPTLAPVINKVFRSA